MTGVRQVPVEAAAAGQRLDRWFREHFPEVTHGRLEKLLRKGEIRVDGRRMKASERLEAGQVVRVPPLPQPATSRPATSRPGAARSAA
ncbi:MAG TPA: S4 domain-containing protein, partial [Kiloniellaceae bacterium]